LAVPFDIPMLYRGDDLVVVDKPHFLATMARGRARRADRVGLSAPRSQPDGRTHRPGGQMASMGLTACPRRFVSARLL
jgi:23S rRNA-/tRNA-specific pseudouridylate synthase